MSERGSSASAPRERPPGERAASALALFDFDGTITTADTFLHFLLREHSPFELARLFPWAAPWIAGWGLRVVEARDAKEAITVRLYRGRSVDSLEAMGAHFASHHLGRLLRPRALERLAWHRQRGHRVVVVTASFRYWIEPWTRSEGLDLVATRLQETGGVLTGHFEGANCNGGEKVRRIRERYELRGYERIYAYGNTRGDRPMMSLAHEAFYRPFE